MPFGQLVDEAELAVVVAGADPVEHGRLDLDAERLAGPLGDLDVEFESVAQDVEHDVGLVGEHLPLDHVAWDLTVDARDLVAGHEPGRRGRAESGATATTTVADMAEPGYRGCGTLGAACVPDAPSST